MMFQPGTYYIGDPGYVLLNDDLRMLFSQIINGSLKPGLKKLVTSAIQLNDDEWGYEYYWCAPTPNKVGTFYDQEGRGWGFDWGCFGVIPWKCIDHQKAYIPNKIEFNEPFDCSFNENNITISYLYFTLNPK